MKIVSIEDNVHHELKLQSAKSGVSMKSYVEKILADRAAGRTMDVTEFDDVMLLATLLDIAEELGRRKDVDEKEIIQHILDGFNIADDMVK